MSHKKNPWKYTRQQLEKLSKEELISDFLLQQSFFEQQKKQHDQMVDEKFKLFDKLINDLENEVDKHADSCLLWRLAKL